MTPEQLLTLRRALAFFSEEIQEPDIREQLNKKGWDDDYIQQESERAKYLYENVFPDNLN